MGNEVKDIRREAGATEREMVVGWGRGRHHYLANFGDKRTSDVDSDTGDRQVP